jgi:hypothetical protein
VRRRERPAGVRGRRVRGCSMWLERVCVSEGEEGERRGREREGRGEGVGATVPQGGPRVACTAAGKPTNTANQSVASPSPLGAEADVRHRQWGVLTLLAKGEGGGREAAAAERPFGAHSRWLHTTQTAHSPLCAAPHTRSLLCLAHFTQDRHLHPPRSRCRCCFPLPPRTSHRGRIGVLRSPMHHTSFFIVPLMSSTHHYILYNHIKIVPLYFAIKITLSLLIPMSSQCGLVCCRSTADKMQTR